MTPLSLYDRLGRTEGIRALARSIAERHLVNPAIAKRFQPLVDDPQRMDRVLQHLCDFLEAGSGGPAPYTGRNMVETHRGMNISGEEYLAVIDDIMASLTQHGLDEATQKDVLYIAYSLKPEIARV